jgi:D-beta-D-heptose 7-phosphate kinase/D-beta-D-heptose 1-phosphate adenosyltransferase
MDAEDITPPNGRLETEWINRIQSLIEKHNVKVVIFSDYNKGTLTDGMIYNLAGHCKERGIITILDPKRPSFSKLSNLHVVKPNVRELKSTNFSPTECSDRLDQCWLINTLGKNGMAIYRGGAHKFSCPTVAQEVIDVCGCGDTVTALLALALYNGLSIEHAVKAANKGASFTIQHMGCYVPSKEEMAECLNK